MPPVEQRLSHQGLSSGGPELSYWLAIARNGYLLAAGDSIDDLAAVVAQFADRDLGHATQGITRDTCVAFGDITALEDSGRPARHKTWNVGGRE